VVRKSQSITARIAEFLFHSGGVLKPIVMLKAYCDESGTHQGAKVLLVSGYIGTSETWDSVEARFKKADKHAGVAFHAVDCATGGKAYRGMDKDKRLRITKKMVKIINDHDIFGVTYGAWLDEYQEIFPRRNKESWEAWIAPVIGILFQGVIGEFCRHIEAKYPGEKLSVVMEDSESWYPTLAKRFIATKKEKTWPHHHLLETIAPYSSEEAVHLYAPDLLAYETYLLKTRERFPTKHSIRKSMLALLQKRLEGKMWDRNGFEVLKLVDTDISHGEKEALIKDFQVSRGL